MKTESFESGGELWIDSHAHLDKLNFSFEEVLQMAKSEGVFRILTIGTELRDWPEVVQISQQRSPEVYGALGMHPHSASSFNKECEDFLKKHLPFKRIAAVGEIGLDYYYEHSDRKIQKQFLKNSFVLRKSLKCRWRFISERQKRTRLFF